MGEILVYSIPVVIVLWVIWVYRIQRSPDRRVVEKKPLKPEWQATLHCAGTAYHCGSRVLVRQKDLVLFLGDALWTCPVCGRETKANGEDYDTHSIRDVGGW